MIDYTAEDLVRRYVNFRHGVAGQGWNLVFCEVCGDGARKKGPRGGFMFTGGDTIFYHCFNCGCNENFSLGREFPFSKGMRNVFDSFGIPSTEYNALLYKRDSTKVTKPKQTVITAHQTIDMPDHFALLSKMDAPDAKKYRDFLKTNYSLSSKDYSFYVCTGETKSKLPKDKADAQTYAKRLIIPYFKNGKMIYFQARDITGTAKLKYRSPDIPKNNILFNIDQLYRDTTEPLYVVEGAMDAIHLNGIATLGNEISSIQKEMLKSSKRRKILVPDFNGDSNKLLEQFIDLQWDVSIPEYRTKCSDVSKAVVNYGKLYTAYDIVKNIKNYKEAKIALPFLNRK